MRSIKTPNNYAVTFLTINFIVCCAKNMIKLIAKMSKQSHQEWIGMDREKRNVMSQIWLRGFELATKHHCNHSSNLEMVKFLNV